MIASRPPSRRVVIRTRQHLAVVLPEDDILLLNTLRFPDEIRKAGDMGIEEDDEDD